MKVRKMHMQSRSFFFFLTSSPRPVGTPATLGIDFSPRKSAAVSGSFPSDLFTLFLPFFPSSHLVLCYSLYFCFIPPPPFCVFRHPFKSVCTSSFSSSAASSSPPLRPCLLHSALLCSPSLVFHSVSVCLPVTPPASPLCSRRLRCRQTGRRNYHCGAQSFAE